MGASSEGDSVVTGIEQRYNETTGEPYDVICFGDHKFHGITGKALTSPDMYYIDVCPLDKGKTESSITSYIKDLKSKDKDFYGDTLTEGYYEDEICNRDGCTGVIERLAPEGGCSCHICPPCGYCTYQGYYCPECDWEAEQI